MEKEGNTWRGLEVKQHASAIDGVEDKGMVVAIFVNEQRRDAFDDFDL